MIQICFVCLGNICRSPTAEAVMRTLVDRAGLSHLIHVKSAGTADYHTGKKPDPRSSAHAQRRGYALQSRARQFVAADFERFDRVIVMDQNNEADVLTLARTPAQRAKVSLLRSFSDTQPEHKNVPDPYYGGSAGFEEVLDICENACAGLLDVLRQEIARR